MNRLPRGWGEARLFIPNTTITPTPTPITPSKREGGWGRLFIPTTTITPTLTRITPSKREGVVASTFDSYYHHNSHSTPYNPITTITTTPTSTSPSIPTTTTPTQPRNTIQMHHYNCPYSHYHNPNQSITTITPLPPPHRATTSRAV